MKSQSSTVIKAQNVHLAARATPFNFEDMAERAKKLLEGVRRQAAQILADAANEAEVIRKRAEEEGRRTGLEQAERIIRQGLEEKLNTLMPALQKAVQEIADARSRFLREWERNGVVLAAAIAAKMVRQRLEHDPQLMLPLVREAVQLAAASPTLRIHFHPADYETLKPVVEEIVKEIAPAAEAIVEADEMTSRGGCRVVTRFGIIDEQLETQANRIVEELLNG